jgi:hypothetical protein
VGAEGDEDVAERSGKAEREPVLAAFAHKKFPIGMKGAQ